MTLYKSIEDWIPQPGRITRSWSSGLVLLQQEFIGSISDNGLVATDGEPFPGDDAGTGAKVYGVPEYRDLGNGLQSAVVSAYGIVPGKAGVTSLAKKEFVTTRLGFKARKQFPSDLGFDGYTFVKYIDVIISLNIYEIAYYNSAAIPVISTPPNEGFHILTAYQNGSVAAGTSLLTTGFQVSDIFPRITTAWSGDHNAKIHTSNIMQSAAGFSFESYGKVSVSIAGFIIMPQDIDFGNFIAPEGYAQPISIPGEGYDPFF
jgi:hypothetical protein